MTIDLILENATFFKQKQSLGAKHVLEHVAILRHFRDLESINHKLVKKNKFFVYGKVLIMKQ